MSVSLTRALCVSFAALFGLNACHNLDKDVVEVDANLVSIAYEKYTLPNGLTVILHEDSSDPLVHVDVTYHVGSAREDIGKSGFAHVF